MKQSNIHNRGRGGGINTLNRKSGKGQNLKKKLKNFQKISFIGYAQIHIRNFMKFIIFGLNE